MSKTRKLVYVIRSGLKAFQGRINTELIFIFLHAPSGFNVRQEKC